jgi:hypothetical protein
VVGLGKWRIIIFARTLQFEETVEQYKEQREIYSQKVRAGKRTYIFDVRATRGNDYYVTITERKRNYEGDGFQKQKIFLYKEDFNKFMNSLSDVVNHVKTELLPDYDYEQFDREREESFSDWPEENRS